MKSQSTFNEKLHSHIFWEIYIYFHATNFIWLFTFFMLGFVVVYIWDTDSLPCLWLEKIFFHSVSCLFTQIIVSFVLQIIFHFMKSYLSILVLILTLPVFCSERHFLCLKVKLYFLLSLLSDLMYQVLCWGLWSIWNWVVGRVRDKELTLFFSVWFTSLTRKYLLTVLFSSMLHFGLFVKT